MVQNAADSAGGTPAVRASEAELASFFSRLALTSYSRRRQSETGVSRVAAAVLCVDIAGFTALAERLAESGAQGAERLSALLNEVLGRVIHEVNAVGGDVIGFAGDSLWAAWLAPDAGETGNDELGHAIALACVAAQKTQAAARRPMPFAETLKLRTVVGTGDLSVLVFGGPKPSSLTFGEAIADASAIFGHAQVGEVLLSAQATSLCSNYCSSATGGSGSSRLVAIKKAPLALPAQPVVVDSELVEVLALTLPARVRELLHNGGKSWFAEFRTVAAVFVGLPGFRAMSDEQLPGVERAVRTIAEHLTRFDGELYQVMMDEKGLVAIGVFGAPPHSHEDDAARAVRTALAVRRDLASSGVSCSIGMAAGRVFHDVCGTTARRYRAIAGPAMNLAARLMQSAELGILCDERIVRAIEPQAGLTFEEPSTLLVKGKREAVLAFRPRVEQAHSGVRPASESLRPMIGRSSELALLTTELTALPERSSPRVVLLEGEAGIGKSRIALHFANLAASRSVDVLTASTDSVDSGTPYFALRSLLEQSLGLDALVTDSAVRRDSLLRALEAHAELVRFMPLLSGLLDLGLPESESTLALAELPRAQKTRDLLLQILLRRSRPLVLVLEDVHWLDASSWDFLADASRCQASMLILLTSRPLDAPGKALETLQELSAMTRLALQPLSPTETRNLVAAHLEVSGIPEEAAAVISSRSTGNALFSIQLAYSMRDLGILTISGDRCAVGPSVEGVSRAVENALESGGVPRTLQGIVISRLDRMAAAKQLVLKVASVLGNSFPAALLAEVCAAFAPDLDARATLHSLLAYDILRTDGEGTEGTWTFRHVLVKEAIYDTIPFAQREQMHRGAAEWYERAELLGSRHGLLGYHWKRAGDGARAVEHLDQAGIEALRAHAIEEASVFFASALELDEAGAGSPPKGEACQRWAGRRLNLGTAHVAWSKYADSRTHLEAGLRWCGRFIPRAAWSATFAILFELLRQIAHRFFPRFFVGRHQQNGTGLRHQAKAFEGLTETYFNLGQNALCLYSALRSLHLAELSGPCAELARGYASFGAIVGFSPWVDLARRYCARAAEVASALSDRPAQAWVAVASGVLEAGLAQWPAAEGDFQRTYQLGKEIGDGRRCDDASENIAAIQYLRGDLRAAMATAEQLWESSHQRNDLFMQADSLRRRAYCQLAWGRTADATEMVERLVEIRQKEARRKGRELQADAYLLRALIHARRGELLPARRDAELGAAILVESSFLFYDVLLEHSTLAEVCLLLRRAGEMGPAPARVACRRLRAFARTFPCARPAAQLWSAVEAWQSGAPDKAQRSWHLAIEQARRSELRYFEAIALFESAAGLAQADAVRVERLTGSLAILQDMGERYYAARVTEALGPPPHGS